MSMNVIRAAGGWNPEGRSVCAAIGVFDGLHLGHQLILRRITREARAAKGVALVVTFDRHPNAVVAPERTPELIYPLSKKLRTLESLGVDVTRLICFDKAFSAQPAEDFVRALASEAGRLQSVCVGEGFTFGNRRRGNVPLLREMGAALKFSVHAMEAAALDGEPVSSTRVRQAIREGGFDLAARLLGRPYALCGPVICGEQLGRALGFPTANLDVAGVVTPPAGVYAATAEVGGKSCRAAVNVGGRPTVDKVARLHVEAHLLDFAGDIYGEELELTFLRNVRDEQKFPSLEALRAQIAADIAGVRALP